METKEFSGKFTVNLNNKFVIVFSKLNEFKFKKCVFKINNILFQGELSSIINLLKGSK